MMSALVKLEPRALLGSRVTSFKCDILCCVSENFLNSPYDNVTVHCGDGASVSTSAVLLAAMSPWWKSLMEGTNISEEFWIDIPSINSSELVKAIRNLTEDKFVEESSQSFLELLKPAHFDAMSTHKTVVLENEPMVDFKYQNGRNEIVKEEGFTESVHLQEESYRESDNEDGQWWAVDRSHTITTKCKTNTNGLKRKRGRPRKEDTSGQERKCLDCEAIFLVFTKKDHHEWVNHQRTHETERFECSCESEWNSIQEKERHMKLVHLGWMSCELCNNITSSKHTYETHMLTHAENYQESPKTRKNERPMSLLCQDCGKVFKNNNYHDRHKYDNHIAKHKIEKFTCGCEVQLNTLVERERHMKVDHLGWFGCPQCLLCFKNKEIQEKHSDTHSLSFICDICGYIGNTKSNLSEHTKRIHETNLVKCPECDKIFKNDQRLMHHKRKVHMARQCPICGEIFKTLRVHLNTVHKTDSEKKYQCQDCGKGFYDRSKLESHRMSIHIKSRPHRCRYGCDIGYNDVSNRNSHEKKKHGGLFVHIVKIDLE